MNPTLLLGLLIAVLFLADTSSLQAQTWETLPNIPKELAFPVVTVLKGKIHVFGGGDAKTSSATNQHFCYDPQTNKWKTLGFLPFQAQQPAGAANAGKIHFFGGGYPKSGQPLNSHYIYDADSDVWNEAAELVPPRAIHYAVSLNDTLYSLAGQSNGANQNVEYLCQTYAGSTNTWATKSKLPDRNFWYGAHVAADGKMYRFGGGGYAAPVATANVYDPTTDTWSSLPGYPTPIHGVSGAAIGDKIFLGGGYTAGSVTTAMWMYDTKAQTYTAATPLPTGRSYHFMVAVDSMIYCIGGNNAADAKVGVSFIRLRPSFGASSVEEAAVTTFSATYADQRLSIRLPEKEGAISGVIQVELFDLLGKSLYKGMVTSPQSSLMVGELRPAVYQVLVRLADGAWLSARVLVDK